MRHARRHRVQPLITTGVCLLLTQCLIAHVANARQFPIQTDNCIVCLDLHTGAPLWEYVPERLVDVEFEWYDVGLLVRPIDDGGKRLDPIIIDPRTGGLMSSFALDLAKLLAKSPTFNPPQNVKLSNGWTLRDVDMGSTKTLEFEDDSHQLQWSVPMGATEQLGIWQDFVYFSRGYYSDLDEAKLYAHQAGGTTPTWIFDANTSPKKKPYTVSRLAFQVLDDRIYAQAANHIFCLDPATGRVLWERDIASEVGLNFGHFWEGGVEIAQFNKSGDILIVAFESRIVAMNEQTGEHLWHLLPDTMPQGPASVIHDGMIVMLAGPNRTLIAEPDERWRIWLQWAKWVATVAIVVTVFAALIAWRRKRESGSKSIAPKESADVNPLAR
jgi:hypothetical protein